MQRLHDTLDKLRPRGKVGTCMLLRNNTLSSVRPFVATSALDIHVVQFLITKQRRVAWVSIQALGPKRQTMVCLKMVCTPILCERVMVDTRSGGMTILQR